jgi:hypothetical protein
VGAKLVMVEVDKTMIPKQKITVSWDGLKRRWNVISTIPCIFSILEPCQIEVGVLQEFSVPRKLII